MKADMAGIGPEWMGAPSDRVSENKFETMMMCFSSMNPTLRKRIASGSTETSDSSSSVAPPSLLRPATLPSAPMSVPGSRLSVCSACVQDRCPLSKAEIQRCYSPASAAVAVAVHAKCCCLEQQTRRCCFYSIFHAGASRLSCTAHCPLPLSQAVPYILPSLES